MKRRLLSAFLAVMMVLTMAPVAFAADDTNTSVDSYEKLTQAIASAENGATITLSSDIDVTQTIVVKDKAITLNLNSKKLYNEKDLWEKPDAGNWSLISVRGTGNLTITGNGTLDAKKDDCYAVDVQDVDASVTIENGTFVGNMHAVYVQKGTAFIKGGSYSIKQKYPDAAKADEFVLNCYDASRATGVAKIIVSGGSFTGFNPASCYAEGEGTNFCAEEYTTQQENTTYTVVEGENTAVANAGANYNTVANAISVAGNGGTVTLLKDVTEKVVIPAGKTVTLDLNGKNIKPTTGDAIVNKGNLTIVGSGEVAAQNSESAAIANFPDATANVKGGTFVSAYWYVIKNLGNMTIDGPVTIKKPEGNTDTSSLIDNGWYGSTDKVAGESVSAQADKAKLTIKSGEFTGKSGSASCSVIKNDDYATLDISGGNFDSTNNKNTSNATTILNWNVATISGGTFIGQYPLANGAYNNAADKGQFTISGGTFTGLQSVLGYGEGGNAVGQVTITDGHFSAPQLGDFAGKYTLEISGGYFTTDPSAYCVTGKTGVASDKDGYKYKVGTVEVKDENEIKTDIKAGTTTAKLGSGITATDKTDATAVGASVTPTKLADTTPITPDDKAQALTELVKNNKVTLNNGEIPAGTTVTVVKETYLDVTVTAYDTTNNTVSMNIVPKYNLIAVAKDGNNAAEQIVLKSAQDAKVGSTEVEVTLPNKFKGQKVYINHNNGANLYVATADKTTGKVKFTTNGFSPFTFALTNPDVVAEVNGNAYKSLQEAANAANNGDEITVVQNKNLDLTFNTTKSVKVTNKTNDKITVKFNGTNKEIAKDKTETFSYTKPSSSGGSSGGSSSGKTTYKVTTSAVNNGGVNASPSNAEKGATITITLSPDKGYKLDKLTVTDGSGKTVSTVKKSDTVYTFTMPASAVKVGVSYVKATETPSETKFNDVSANDWFASAVDYVTGKGMMNGTADNTFSPKANTTRGMVVTVLYRLENQPSTSAASFTDVASGAYYANAVAWANANGIVSGYGSGKFGPNDKVTREQLAAILYRYAQYKKYDVSVGEDTNILSYNDAQSISSYAIPAIQWACGAGVVTGKSGSKLDPKGNATRAEVAAMLMRFCENVK